MQQGTLLGNVATMYDNVFSCYHTVYNDNNIIYNNTINEHQFIPSCGFKERPEESDHYDNNIQFATLAAGLSHDSGESGEKLWYLMKVAC